MAKKIVRGITDVKTINNQDFDTNNVNDLLSDGQYNYIHRKKGKNEEYHNLTDNIKTISSDNTELLSVTNYNKTTNTATLHPKHDKQKEQLLESTRNTITIHHGTNGTAEKTTVDTNPQKVLEHENLISDSEYITLQHQTGENTTHIKTAALKQELNELHQTKQDTLVAGEGITIDGQTISASGAKHDAQKEQLLESTRNTIAINHGTNGTAEKTTVDTNPQKVLEHENLLTIDGISKTTTENVTTIGLKTIDNYSGDLNELTEICLVKPTNDALNLPFVGNGEGILTVVKIGDTVSQKYHDLNNIAYTRVGTYSNGAWVWTEWTCVTPSSPGS